VRTTVPSGLVTGFPGEILLPTSTTRFTPGNAGILPAFGASCRLEAGAPRASFKTSSMPASSVGAMPENKW